MAATRDRSEEERKALDLLKRYARQDLQDRLANYAQSPHVLDAAGRRAALRQILDDLERE